MDEEEREQLDAVVDAAMRHLDMTGEAWLGVAPSGRKQSCSCCSIDGVAPAVLCLPTLPRPSLPKAASAHSLDRCGAGPIWRPPAPNQVVRSLDVFSGAPTDLTDMLLAHARLTGVQGQAAGSCQRPAG